MAINNPIWAANPKLKSLLLVFIFVFLASGVGLAVFSYAQNQYQQKLYQDMQVDLPKKHEQETGLETVCKTNNDCWCRAFTGAGFIPGNVRSSCNLKTNRCQQCTYE